MLANGLAYNHTVVKLDLSNNGFKTCTIRFLLEALSEAGNSTLADLNLAGNFLDDDFALLLANFLESNQVLHTVDISRNPIGAEGAKFLLQCLL